MNIISLSITLLFECFFFFFSGEIPSWHWEQLWYLSDGGKFIIGSNNGLALNLIYWCTYASLSLDVFIMRWNNEDIFGI